MDVFFDVLTVSEAAAQLMINWQPQLMPGEEVDFSRALGRILAKAVLASEDVPPLLTVLPWTGLPFGPPILSAPVRGGCLLSWT